MRKLILVVALLLLAGGAWSLSTLFQSAEAAPTATPPTGEPRARGAAEQRVTPPPTDQPQRTVADTPTPEVDDGRFAYRVRVVRHPGNEPVVGAALHWLPPDFDYAALPAEDLELLNADRVQFYARHGEQAESDTDGRATLRADPQHVYVLARAGDLFGQQSLSARERGSEEPPDPGQEFTLLLREDRTLVARAVDGSGRPLPGVRIQLLTEHGNSDGDTSKSISFLGPTDENGIASLPHAQEYPRQPTQGELAVEMFGGSGEPTAIDLVDPPRQPVDVVAPPFGSLEIVLLGPDGRPWLLASEREVRVMIKRADEEQSGSVTTSNSLYLERTGSAVAEPVLCGQELRVWATAGTMHEAVVEGPRLAGQRVRVELAMPADTPILLGKLVDAQGAPITEPARLEYEYKGGSGSHQIGVDEAGRFRVPLIEWLVGATPRVTVILVDERGIPGDTKGQASLPGPLTSGPNDVGEIVLGEAPILVAGRVEWTDGTPVEPPQVGLERTREGRGTSWTQARESRPEHPGEGRFVVRGLHQGHRFRLRVSGDFQPVEPVEFEPGTRDLVIRVAKAGSVHATFLLEKPTSSWTSWVGGLEFRLRPASSETTVDRRDFLEHMRRQSQEQAWAQPNDDGVACTWGSLAAGNYRLTVRCPGLAEPVVEVTGIAVAPGEPTDDARLRGIDLRGRVHRLHVTVTDSQGQPIRGKEAAVVLRGGEDPGREWFGRSLVGDDGRVPFLVDRPVDLIVTAPGFRTRQVASVFADTTVALEPAPQVRFQLTGTLPDLPDGVGIGLAVMGAERSTGRRPSYRVHDGTGGSQGRSLDKLLGDGMQRLALKNGSAELDVVHYGPRTLRLRLYRRVERRLRVEYVDARPATVDLDRLRPGQVIEVHFDPEAVRAAVAELLR